MLSQRATTRLVAAALTAVVAIGWASPARADDNADERDRQNAAAAQAKADVALLQQTKALTQSQQAAAQQDVHESSAALQAATAKLDQSRTDLKDAQAKLEVAQQDVVAAERADAQAAGQLAQTQVLLKAADQLVTKNQASLEAQQARVGQVAREEYQQNSNLVGIATLVTPTTVGDVNNRLQWNTTMIDTTAAQITRLEDEQTKLAEAKNARAVLTQQADTMRAKAADSLTKTQKAQAAADDAKKAVASAVAANQAAESNAQQALASDEAILQAKDNEMNQVNARIAQRVADQKAAETAAQKAEAARVAAEQARQAAAAAAAAKQAGSQQNTTQQSSTSTSSSSGSSGLIYPVSAPITSPYGMRLHPILGIWKLHDGTDFGAGCGTPIKAAASGVVTDEYYNGGYGNRLFIDHGSIGGRYMTTAYNHLSGYAVSVGQRVSQGQVIGYVGTTGYSTGCHLHLMLWVNGTMVNPMNYY